MPWLCCHRTPKVKREDQYKVGSVLPLCGVADGTLSNEKALRWPTTWTSRRLLRRMVRRPCSRGECFYWLEVSNRGLVTFISTALVADTPRRVCSPHTVTRHSDFGDFSWHVVTFPLQHICIFRCSPSNTPAFVLLWNYVDAGLYSVIVFMSDYWGNLLLGALSPVNLSRLNVACAGHKYRNERTSCFHQVSTKSFLCPRSFLRDLAFTCLKHLAPRLPPFSSLIRDSNPGNRSRFEFAMS